MVVFQLEEMDCVVCNFYGYTSKVPTQKRYNLINLATRLIDDCVVKWSMGMGPGRKISVVWGGDFNTLSNSMAPIASSSDAINPMLGFGPSRAKKNCPGCNVDHLDTYSRYECPPRAMDILEKQFTHVNTIHMHPAVCKY